MWASVHDELDRIVQKSLPHKSQITHFLPFTISRFTSRAKDERMTYTTDVVNEIKTTAHMSDEELGSEKPVEAAEDVIAPVEDTEVIKKIPPLTPIYWCEKMTATTFGETFADFFSQTLGFGYGATSTVLLSFFAVVLGGQLYVKSYWPNLFWLVMASSSVAGTLISDFIDRTLGWGYPLGMGVLLSILLVIIGIWKLTGESMNVAGAMTRKAEVFYWSTILVSNTLGTALGDFLSDSLNLGFGLGAGIIGGLLVICGILAYFTRVSHVLLFWVAFVLTRPFGATFGDLLTKSKEKGGLDLGTLKASMVILALFLICFAIEMYMLYKAKKAKAAKLAESEGDV
ncbi:hypothetical protein ACA910_008212 [Epithemia clementina (nom. ined.)]